MTRVDIMVDIETLGTSANSTIFQIAAVAFDITNGSCHTAFNEHADISKNEGYDMQVSGETLKWWVLNHPETFAELLGKGELSSEELIKSFYNWLNWIVMTKGPSNVFLWGNGILFDNNMLKTQMETNGLTYPVHFRNDRDVRTIVDLACVKTGLTINQFRTKWYDPDLQSHDAFDDVRNQINMVAAAYRKLTSNDNLSDEPIPEAE